MDERAGTLTVRAFLDRELSPSRRIHHLDDLCALFDEQLLDATVASLREVLRPNRPGRVPAPPHPDQPPVPRVRSVDPPHHRAARRGGLRRGTTRALYRGRRRGGGDPHVMSQRELSQGLLHHRAAAAPDLPWPLGLGTVWPHHPIPKEPTARRSRTARRGRPTGPTRPTARNAAGGSTTARPAAPCGRPTGRPAARCPSRSPEAAHEPPRRAAAAAVRIGIAGRKIVMSLLRWRSRCAGPLHLLMLVSAFIAFGALITHL